jgi:hypothetical protein
MKHELKPEDLSVRPVFRVLGALLLSLLAYIFFTQGIELFSAESIQPELCKHGKGRLFCEAGNLIILSTPTHLQGPLTGGAYVTFSFLLSIISIWLIKPIFTKS